MPPKDQNTNPNTDQRSRPTDTSKQAGTAPQQSTPYQTGNIPDDLRKEAKEFGVEEKPMAPAAPFPQQESDKPVSEETARILKEVKLPERKAQVRGGADRPTDTQTPATPPTPEAPPQQTTPTPPRKEADIPSIRTLKHDLSTITEREKLSLVQATALEEAKRSSRAHKEEAARAARASAAPKRSGRGRRILIVIIILTVLGVGAIIGTLLVMQAGSPTVPVPPPSSGLIFAENAEPVRVDGLQSFELKQRLATARTGVSLSLGAMLHIVPYAVTTEATTGRQGTRTLSAGEFLAAIGSDAPGSLVRALNDEFFFGFHRIDDNLPVFVFTVNSYERAFDGMLDWEETIDSDLAPLFPEVERETVRANGELVVREFEDRIIRNYDVRILRDQFGDIQLLYAFPNRSILIVAESPYSFIEALARLQAERRL